MIGAPKTQGKGAPGRVAALSQRRVADGTGGLDNRDARMGSGRHVRPGCDRKAIVTAAMGIGNSPKLLREVVSLGMFCLMRVTKKVRVMMEDGEVSPSDELSDEPGTSWRRKARAFKKSVWIGR